MRKLHKFKITAEFTHKKCVFEYISKDSCGIDGVFIEIRNKKFIKGREKSGIFSKNKIERFYNLSVAESIDIEDCGRCE